MNSGIRLVERGAPLNRHETDRPTFVTAATDDGPTSPDKRIETVRAEDHDEALDSYLSSYRRPSEITTEPWADAHDPDIYKFAGHWLGGSIEADEHDDCSDARPRRKQT